LMRDAAVSTPPDDELMPIIPSSAALGHGV
jgi:hypothetical protein